MQPLQTTVIGTGSSVPWIMDYMQNPFQVSIGCVLGTAAGGCNVVQ